jgi:tocopherol O-methyltransferase
MADPGDPGHPQAVASYYDETWVDYRALWLNRHNRAIHMGYWDEATRHHSESLLNNNRVMADHAGLCPGQRALDAGCGVGGTAMWVAENRGASVMGITLSADQAARATRYSAERGISRQAIFSRQDYRRTAFRDSSFDVVYAMESVCYATDKRAFLAEAYRLLRPGGRLVVHDAFRFDRPYSEREERLHHSWIGPWAVPDLAQGEQFTSWAREVGFGDVRLEDHSRQVGPSVRRLYRLTMALYPLAALLHALGLRSDVQHGNVKGARNQWRALKGGVWFYGILSARKPAPDEPASD